MGTQYLSPPPLEGGGWGEGFVPVLHRRFPHGPLPPSPSRKGRGSVFASCFAYLPRGLQNRPA
jgi:hypothetical protein